MKNKSQTTLFVIVSILIVSTILLFFFITRGKTILKPEISYIEPEEYIKKCAKDSVTDAINILLDQGGNLNPKNYLIFENKKVSFLCYNRNYYSSCIIQYPLLVNHIENEIIDYSLPKIKDCLYNLSKNYKERGYEIDYDQPKLEIKLKPNKVDINILFQKGLIISKEDSLKKYDEIKTYISSPIYDLADLALEIASQEAKYCYFSVLGYSLLYQRIEVKVTPSLRTLNNPERIERGKIYILKDIYSGKKFYFAVRGCEIPPGI
ncbi:MAG: hypothetical protein QW117_01800 [Candidatus Pacearchaeota archaeon]